jgi:hypothetical protein
MNDSEQKKSSRKFRLMDFLVILLCLIGAAFSFNQFRLDMSKKENPVGTIIIRNNVVQRRMANRALWDRLAVDSPAYTGDTIRTADLSNATLYIERNSIDLDGKTLIRIQRSPDDEDSIVIYLDEGNLVITTVTGGGNIALNIMGRHVEAAPGTVLSASAGKDGAVVQVSEGTATLTGDGQRREISSGEMIALDAGGAERTVKSAVMQQPKAEARYLKDGPEPLLVNFAWNRINLDAGETLCLELAEDRNFNRIIRVIENLDTTTEIALNAGNWYWRLSLTSPSATILSTGRLTVADASGPALLSPATDSVIRYQDKLPGLRFQWSEIAGASSYVLEASETPDFINPRLRTHTASVFFFESGLGPGTWYWRVMPVFPPVYEGTAAFSPAGFFRIVQGGTGVFIPVLPEPVTEQAEQVPFEQVLLEQVPFEQGPLLPAPLDRLPFGGHRIGIEQLKETSSIVFSWSEVQGANAYIFTLYQDTAGVRRQIIRVPPENRRNWTLENLSALGSGTFIWQVEAVSLSPAGTVERRGRIGENYFIIDIPQPGQVRIEDPGTLYGY